MRCFPFISRREFARILSKSASSVINKCASARESNKKTSATDSLREGEKNSPRLMSLQMRDSFEDYMIKNAVHRPQQGLASDVTN